MSDFARIFRYFKDKPRRIPYDKNNEENIEGKIIIVTGANAGLGKAITSALAERKAVVILACRNLEKAQSAIADIRKTIQSGTLTPLELDLEDLSSIRNFAGEIKKQYPHINILINNAGYALGEKRIVKTKEGFESHMGINHLGPFLLTNLLIDHLKKGSNPGRIVNVVSTNYQIAKLDLDDMMLEKNPPVDFGFGNYLPYNNSKKAQIYFCGELARRLKGSGVNVYAVCPGLINSDFFRNDPKIKQLSMKILGVSPQEASKNVLYCALSKKTGEETGLYYRFGNVWSVPNDILNDEKSGREVWEKSENYLGVSF